MRRVLPHYLLVAVRGKIVGVCRDFILEYGKTLCRARALFAVTLFPTHQYVGKIIFRVVIVTQPYRGHRAELGIG